MSAQDRIRSLRLSMRFIAPLVVTLAVLGYALLPVVDRLTLRWWVNETDVSAVHLYLLTREDDPISVWQPSNLHSVVETLASADEP